MNANAPFDEQKEQAIAIIGMAGRFPGAQDIEEFWSNLCAGQEAITFFSDEELLEAGLQPAHLRDPQLVRAGGVLQGAELFDAGFFGYSPAEARSIDPQQRLLLETAWHALEYAGYTAEAFQGRIGVYVGQGRSNYLLPLLRTSSAAIKELDEDQLMLGHESDFLATRISYKLDLRGPSFTVQTACSTSLVAVHLASQALLSGECDMALAGGVAVRFPQKSGFFYQEGSIDSPDGHCRAFDALAQGTISGNGLGLVVLKRLEDALADHDTIYAVIKGSAINNDGAFKISYVAPSVQGQAAVIAEVLALTGVDPETIGYIEAHGTGTSLGDPIEIAALTQAFREYTERRSFCAIGSVKTNIGHLDKAAGIAGLIKTVLALYHAQIPPSLHFQQPNPQINFAASPFYVNTHLSTWPATSHPRRAGVSSFGMGGTNAHVLLEEAPEEQHSITPAGWQILPLSARTPSALEAMSRNLARHLKERPMLSLADVAYTLQLGRTSFAYRAAFVCRDTKDASELIEQQGTGRRFVGEVIDARRQIVFLFPGQGSQYAGMGRDLYQQEPVFRACVDRYAELFQTLTSIDLRSVLHLQGEWDGQLPETGLGELDQTWITQPALFVIEYALAQLLIAWGLEPDAMIGHSIGEYVAATLAGVFSPEDALSLITLRARLMQEMPRGAMLSVALSEQEIRPFMQDGLDLAAVNAPAQCVLSGPIPAIEHCMHRLAEKNIMHQRLRTSHAFHSVMVEPMLDHFAEKLRGLSLQIPTRRYISNLTGDWITAEQAKDPAYWVQHLRQTVLFSQGIQHLAAEQDSIFLEVGPGRGLAALVHQQGSGAGSSRTFTALPGARQARQEGGESASVLALVGQLWVSGCQIDWSALHTSQLRRRIALPLYPFERQRYWLDFVPGAERQAGAGVPAGPELPVTAWFSVPGWRQTQPPKVLASQDQKQQPTSWLLFGEPDDALCTSLREHLVRRGDTVILVLVGEQFARISSDVYTIDLKHPEAYSFLLNELQEREIFPAKIIHMWLAKAARSSRTYLDRYDYLQQRGFYAFLFLAQAIDRCNWLKPLYIYIVTDQMLTIAHEGALVPEQATLIGLSKVIMQEYPSLACMCIDVVWPETRTWEVERLTGQLLIQVNAPWQSREQVVAYRARNRWIQVYEPLTLPQVPDQALPLREQGVYLITGGTGRLGLLWARWLALRTPVRLVLTAHTPWPTREAWPEYLRDHPDSAMSTKIRSVQELEQLGAEVVISVCDISNEQHVQDLFTAIDQRFGTLHGVIYAAGFTGEASFRSIPESEKEFCERHFRSKVAGLLVFNHYLEHRTLDFCLLQSSLASQLGGLGLAAYAAANSFLDAWCQNAQGPLPWISLNWDSWQFSTGEVEQGITPEEGLQAFAHIFSVGPIPQILISRTDLARRLQQAVVSGPTQEQDASVPEYAGSALRPRSRVGQAPVAPRNGLEQTVATVWERVLGLAEVGIYDDFLALGGHSLLASQVAARLREAFAIEIPLRSILEASTVEEQALVIETLLIEKLETLSEAEAQQFMQRFS